MGRVAVFLLLFFLAPVALAGGAMDLYEALDRERSEGDYRGAMELFRRAAASEDATVAAQARLGEARCLVRLGRRAEARTVLEALLAGSPPARFAGIARRDLERLTPKEEAEAPPPPESAEEKARRERERDRELREELAAFFVSQARAFYREARFDEARDRLARALELSPENREARELLGRLGNTPGGRERLVREVLRLLDEERRLHLAELLAEVDARISAGEEALRAGEHDEAVRRFDLCLRLIDTSPTYSRSLAERRKKVRELRRRATLLGGRSSGLPPPPVSRDESWRESLTNLLTELASSPGGETNLRIHGIDVPPAPPPGGEEGTLRLLTERGDTAGLLVRLIPLLVRPDAWKEGGPFLSRLGKSLIVYGEPALQDDIEVLLNRIAARQDPPIRVAVDVVAAEPSALFRAAKNARLRFSTATGGAAATLEPALAERFLEELSAPDAGESLGRREVVLFSGGAVRLIRRRALNLPSPGRDIERVDFGLDLSLLAVRQGEFAGVSVAADTTRIDSTLSLPSRGGAIRVPTITREEGAASAKLPPGGGLVLAGLANPFPGESGADRGELVLVVRVLGRTRSRPAEPEPPAAEGPVPVTLHGLDISPPDHPAPAFRGEGARPTESRPSFLLKHLWQSLGAAPDASITLSRGVVWVRGDEALLGRVRSAVSELVRSRERLFRVRVRAAVLTAEEEGRLASGLASGGRVIEGEGVKVFHLKGEDLRRVAYLVSGAEGRYVLLEDAAYARATQLVSLVRSTRFTYLAGFRSGSAGAAWPVYDSVEEGLAVEARPLVRPEDRVELHLTIRVARILGRDSSVGETGAPGKPVQTIAEAKLAGELTDVAALLVTGLVAPTPVRERREALVLVVQAAEASIPK